ncbi:MAG TPA: folate-binding protein [Rhodanobacteraceae bacterium]|nr:folate-binding protein [Rhodanobacteraceae bacterium]
MQIASLPAIGHVDCIVIEGADARRFAQSQFSGDVDALAPGRWQWNAWLNAQGRVQALMHLADPGDGTLLAVLRGGDANATRDGLGRFLLRRKATLRVQTFTARIGGPQPATELLRDGDSLALGYGLRSFWLDPVVAPNTACDAAAHADWRLADIKDGWPSLPRDAEPRYIPQALGLERLGAIAFKKGCYPGQEIVARLHYRGAHKYKLAYLQGSVPPPPGEAREGDGSISARILDAVLEHGTCHVLAVIGIHHSSEINILGNIYRIVDTFQS